METSKRILATSDSIEMDQDLAKRLFFEGGTVILLNVPKGMDFGIDLKSWNTGEHFKGIKMIPPGFHYIHYSVVNDFGDQAPRIGFIHWFQKSELVVRSWNVKEEDFSSEPITEEKKERLKQDLLNLDKYLGPYPLDTWKQWQELTNRIEPAIVERCTPTCGFIRSALELENFDDNSRPRGSESSRKRKRRTHYCSIEKKEDELLPDLKPKKGTQLRFTELPDKHYPEDATPSEITRHSLDSTYTLNIFLSELKKPVEIIGEFQLAFVCFLVGQSLDAFEHWKSMVSLICRADSAIPDRRLIYLEFLRTIEAQLAFIPEEFLYDIVASNNIVYHNLRRLFANIEANSNIDLRLKSEAVRMRDRISNKFLWDFSNLQEEDEDDAPVVVMSQDD